MLHVPVTAEHGECLTGGFKLDPVFAPRIRYVD
jgi:hypothetical protein